MSEIEWRDPPEYVKVIGSGGQPGRHAKFAVDLREHPGRWAVLPDAGVSTEASAMAKAQNIRRGKVKGFKAGEYETAADGMTIYVRYVGPREKQVEEPEPEEEEPPPPPVKRPKWTAAEVRAWATTNGFNVPSRGRLPQELVDQYLVARERRRNIRAVER